MGDHESVSAALTELGEALAKTLTNGQQLLAGMPLDEFVDEKIGCMFEGAHAYKQCYQRLGVQNREELEAAFQKQFRFQHIQTGFDDLLQTETEWSTFLESVDKKIKGQCQVDEVRTGDDGPMDFVFRDVRSDTDVTLKKYVGSESQADFDAAGGRVLVVTFGVREGALRWLEETKLPYDMLMDPERKLYQAVGLHRSVAKTWHTESLMYYGEQMAAGRTLPSPFEKVVDDPHQMGGDIVINPKGKVTMIHCSQNARDRPTVEQLLDFLKPMKAENPVTWL